MAKKIPHENIKKQKPSKLRDCKSFWNNTNSWGLDILLFL